MKDFDNPNWRAHALRRAESFDLPLYRASLAADFESIRKLLPMISKQRAQAMAEIARAFRPLKIGWVGSAFFTALFDPNLGIWRREQCFVGPMSGKCAVCGRPSVYRRRDTLFCRMHGPTDPVIAASTITSSRSGTASITA
jgi:hypothetical protein